MNPLASWLSEYALLFSAVASISILLLLVTLAATPWLVASLPSDYLQPKSRDSKPLSIFRLVILALRNLAGFFLVILGLIFMLTPGPGLVVLLMGISLAEFPGKQRLLLNIATQPSVFKSLNWMRTRHGKPPFDYPETTI